MRGSIEPQRPAYASGLFKAHALLAVVRAIHGSHPLRVIDFDEMTLREPIE
jgi:hypothetical protein